MAIPDRAAIGDVLQDLRVKAGFKTANSFAEYVGINSATYTGYEQGKGMFTYERAWLMADALECSMDELGGRQWPPEGEGAGAQLSAGERSLVDCYRRMEPEDQDAIDRTARGLAYAGDAKKEDAGRHAPLADRDLTARGR